MRGGATTRTNEEIVAAFQSGDQSALSELWANNERGVKYMADKIAAAGLGDAEDLLQEGFFGLLKAAGGLRSGRRRRFYDICLAVAPERYV